MKLVVEIPDKYFTHHLKWFELIFDGGKEMSKVVGRVHDKDFNCEEISGLKYMVLEAGQSVIVNDSGVFNNDSYIPYVTEDVAIDCLTKSGYLEECRSVAHVNGYNECKEEIYDILKKEYERGFEDGMKSIDKDDWKHNAEQTFHRGILYGWQARSYYDEVDDEQRKEIFGHKQFANDKEIIEGVKKYIGTIEEELYVGDEVQYIREDGDLSFKTGVILGMKDKWYEVRFAEIWNCVAVTRENLMKTGRHFDQIGEVFKELKGGE